MNRPLFRGQASGILFTGSNDYRIAVNASSLRSANGALIFQTWGSGTLTVNGSVTNILGSNIEKHGPGKLVLRGLNSNASGTATLIAGGILSINSNGSLGNNATGSAITLNGGTLEADTTASSIALNNAGANNRNITVGLAGGTLDVVGGNNLTVSGVISSTTSGVSNFYAAPLTLGSASTNGSFTLNGTNTYTGGTILRGGTVEVQSAAALGSTAAASNNFVQFTGGSLRYGSGITTDYSQRIRYSSSTVSINTNGNNVTFASGIDYTNTAGLTKLGAGTLSLNGTNTYSGGTTVTTGTLAANNRNALGTGSVTISSGAALTTGVANVQTGAFTSTGNFTLNGASAGTVTLGTGTNLSLTGGTWFYTAGDQFIGTATSIFSISGVTLDLTGIAQGTYTLASGFNASGTAASFAGYTFSDPSYFANLELTGGTLSLTVVPEPSTYAMGILGLLGLLVLARNHRRRAMQ